MIHYQMAEYTWRNPTKEFVKNFRTGLFLRIPRMDSIKNVEHIARTG